MTGHGLLRLEDCCLEQSAPRDVAGIGQRGARAPLAAHSGRIHSRSQPSFVNHILEFDHAEVSNPRQAV
jgi:hypothetical protein